MTKSELERLAILVEECAEVQQIAMKIIRHGAASYNPFDQDKTLNSELLEREIGDLSFAVEFMIQKGAKIEKYLHYNTAKL